MKVMLIDDDKDSLQSLGGCLQHNGHEAFLYADPGQAIEEYDPEKVDVVITDINMPRLDGITVLRQIKAIDPEAYVLMLTGYADLDNSISALNNGAHLYLRKPIGIKDLLETLKQVENERFKKEKLYHKANQFETTVKDLDQTYQELQSHVVAVDQVHSVISKVHEAMDINHILIELVGHVTHLMDCEYSMITFRDGIRHYCRCHARSKETPGLGCNCPTYCMDNFPVQNWVKNSTALLDNDPSEKVRQSLRAKGIVASNLITTPLVQGGRTLGILAGFNKPGGFTGNDKFMLNMIGSTAVTAIFNNSLIDQLKEMFETTIESLVKTIDAKDSYTRGHTSRVSKYTLEIGRALGWSEEQLEQAYAGTLFHDIGKIGIPDHVLNKKGALTDVEFKLMKNHVIIGYEILKDIPKLKGVLDYVLCHHERFDGKGYPRGLASEEIPIEGRVVCVADSFDAMMSDRSYRKALPLAQAISELEKGAGTQFDPLIAEIVASKARDGEFNEILACKE